MDGEGNAGRVERAMGLKRDIELTHGNGVELKLVIAYLTVFFFVDCRGTCNIDGLPASALDINVWVDMAACR